MATRRTGRAIEGLTTSDYQWPPIDVDGLALQTIADANQWLGPRANGEVPAFRTGLNRVAVETDGLKLLLRPAMQMRRGHAYMVAWLSGDEVVHRKLDVLAWIAGRARAYGLTQFAWECAFDGEAECARALEAVEYSPGDFVVEVEDVIAAIGRWQAMTELPAYMRF